jgi:hypothetical protein
MKTKREMCWMLLLVGAVATSGCARKETAGPGLASKPAHGSDQSTPGTWPAAPPPAPWEPIDKSFKSCEGG